MIWPAVSFILVVDALVSAGVAVYVQVRRRSADAARYQAKRDGRDRVVLASIG